MSDHDDVQKLIQRTRANREILNKHLTELGMDAKPMRSPLKDENRSNRDGNSTASPIDDEVQKLLQKTRANREKLSKHLQEIGESPMPNRSPLRDRNPRIGTGSPSPSKVVRSDTFTKSPSRIRTNAKSSWSNKKTEESLEDENSPNTLKESVSRESVEKTSIIEGSPKREGNRETYTRTTVTEKEEKVHKTEHVKFTQYFKGGRASMIEDPEERIRQITASFKERDNNGSNNERVIEDTKITSKSTTRTSTSRSPSPKPRLRSPSPKKTSFHQLSPDRSSARNVNYATPIVTSSNRTVEEYDEDVFGPSGRKRRLADLAKKFQRYDDDDAQMAKEEQNNSPYPMEEDEEESPLSRNQMNVTKEVDVDEELAAAEANSRSRSPSPKASPHKYQRQSQSPSKTPKLNKDPNFMSSLRAQGFEESSSKTKLVYDFNKDSPATKQTILSSPTKTAAEPRPTSPHKPHPLQFISPKVNNAMAKAQSSRQVEQDKSNNSRMERPQNIYKPHPLQFVSPQKSPVMPRKTQANSEPPNKPVRTWATVESCESKGTPTPPPTAPKPPSGEMTDTASRRSIAEKWSMFEGQSAHSDQNSPVDPATLSLSERRALFEKNRSAPKPVARFGDAVTPSMLSKGQSRYGNVPSNQLFTPRARSPPGRPLPNPKRGRSVSPCKQTESPAKEASQERPSSPMSLARFISRSPERPKVSPPKANFKDSWKQESQRSVSSKHESPERSAPKSPKTSPGKAKSPRRTPSPDRQSPNRGSPSYPGVNSLKRIKVSPPKPGSLYPQIAESSDEDRPGTSMSMHSTAPSEAPSLGAAIKRAASAHRQIEERRKAMPSISETCDDSADDGDEEMTECGGEIDDMLDEALDDSMGRTSEGPTPPKAARRGLSPTASAGSWEFQTPALPKAKKSKDYKTPLVEELGESPQRELPQVEGEEGVQLIHTVSFYRRQKPQLTLTPHQKIVRKEEVRIPLEEEKPKENIQQEIHKLQDEVEEQRQRMEQASKAINVCVSRGEFEGSDERVKAESVLLEATHKFTAAMSEIKRLSTEGAIGKDKTKSGPGHASKGAISISGIALPLKREFLKMLKTGGDQTVHYFVVLIKYRGRVIATQMLSTDSEGSNDGITKGKLVFPNLINLRDLDFDFQIYLEVYGLQTRKEHIDHDLKYHIRKEKSMFNLTPLKKLKKQESSPFPRNQNPVNSKTIRRPAFGMVGYAVINIETLKNRAFQLDKVPDMSPLDGGLEMTLTIHSESRIEQRGFLTLFTDVNGYGDWCRRWCRLSGNALHFWKYPEDEGKVKPSEQIVLTSCITNNVTLAPRDVCSRMNTFMLETKRSMRHGDQDSLVMAVNRKSGQTKIKHLLSADTRDERIGWCSILNRALENIRAWDPSAFRPRSDSLGSQSSVDSTTAGSSVSTEIW